MDDRPKVGDRVRTKYGVAKVVSDKDFILKRVQLEFEPPTDWVFNPWFDPDENDMTIIKTEPKQLTLF